MRLTFLLVFLISTIIAIASTYLLIPVVPPYLTIMLSTGLGAMGGFYLPYTTYSAYVHQNILENIHRESIGEPAIRVLGAIATLLFGIVIIHSSATLGHVSPIRYSGRELLIFVGRCTFISSVYYLLIFFY